MKPSKLIRLGGVPETATKDDVSGRFVIQKLLFEEFLKVPFFSLVDVSGLSFSPGKIQIWKSLQCYFPSDYSGSWRVCEC